tara:strand:+ start:293 stop:790 length:498 start_codon:yes stop_codon:yes gene_type:complete
MLVLVAVIVILGLMVLRIHSPFNDEIRGTPVHYTALTIGQKMLVSRWYILAVLAINSAGIIPGMEAFRTNTDAVREMLVMVVVLGSLFVPLRYHFFKEGFALGGNRIKHWERYSDYRFANGKIMFVGKEGVRSEVIYVNDVQQKALRSVLPSLVGRDEGSSNTAG